MTKTEEVIKIIKSCIGTKFVSKWSDLACKIALEAVNTVQMEENGRKEIDIKRYARIEKVLIFLFFFLQSTDFGKRFSFNLITRFQEEQLKSQKYFVV